MNALLPILEHGRSPADWVELLAARGFEVSERTLREKANRLGACIKLGRAMIITPEHMDVILKDGEQCPSNRISEVRPGGRAAGSNITAPRSATTSAAALAHLQKLARGNGAGRKKIGGSVVTFSAMKGR